MIEGLPWPIWLGVAGTGWALVALFVGAIIKGRIVPRSAIDDERHDANEWRTEARIKDQQIVVKDEQIAAKDKQLGYLAEVGETMKSVLANLHELARRDGPR